MADIGVYERVTQFIFNASISVSLCGVNGLLGSATAQITQKAKNASPAITIYLLIFSNTVRGYQRAKPTARVYGDKPLRPRVKGVRWMAMFQARITHSRLVFSPFTSEQMMNIAQVTLDHVRGRIQSVQDVNDSHAKPLKGGAAWRSLSGRSENGKSDELR
jgi:hypothetical protein